MKKTLFILLVIASLNLAACGAGESSQKGDAPVPGSMPAGFSGRTNPSGPDAGEAGAVVYNTNCVACHGPQGHGDGPAGAALDPAPKNLPELSTTAGDDFLFWRISTGSPGTSMPGWNGVLTEEQIWQVITYIRTLK